MATEDLVYSLHNLGYHTGINVLELARTGGWICERLRRENGSRAGSAILARIAWEEDEEIKRSRRERSREWREVIKLKNYGFLVIAGGVGAVLAAWQAKEFYQSTEFAQLRSVFLSSFSSFSSGRFRLLMVIFLSSFIVSGRGWRTKRSRTR
jgi:hypothetical protein